MTDESPSVDASGPGVAPVAAGKAPHRRWYRLALLITLLLVALTLVTVPTTMTSMGDVLGRAPDPVYDLLTGRQVTGAEAAAAAADAVYVNLGLVDLDEGSGLITIAVSGNRHCAGTCPTLALTLTALDDDGGAAARLAPIGHADAGPRGPGLQPVGAAAGPRPTQPLPLRRLPAVARGGRGGNRGGRDDPGARPGHGGRGGDGHGAEPHLRSGDAAPRPDRPQAQRARPPTRPRSSPCSPCGSSARPTSSAWR